MQIDADRVHFGAELAITALAFTALLGLPTMVVTNAIITKNKQDKENAL